LGADFYRRAAAREEAAGKAQLLDCIAGRSSCGVSVTPRLNRELRDLRYILTPAH
jgi:hypothetical protein